MRPAPLQRSCRNSRISYSGQPLSRRSQDFNCPLPTRRRKFSAVPFGMTRRRKFRTLRRTPFLSISLRRQARSRVRKCLSARSRHRLRGNAKLVRKLQPLPKSALRIATTAVRSSRSPQHQVRPLLKYPKEIWPREFRRRQKAKRLEQLPTRQIIRLDRALVAARRPLRLAAQVPGPIQVRSPQRSASLEAARHPAGEAPRRQAAV